MKAMSQTINAFPTHLLATQFLSATDIYSILDLASTWIGADGQLLPAPPLLQQKTVANLFFENSTRTRCAFELAAQRLGAYVLNLDVSTSSTQKGETLLDTARYLQAMGVDQLVLRDSQSGSPSVLAAQLDEGMAIINAGDGTNEHPSQALLDIFTIRCYKPNLERLSIAIVGDILHSRVARSLCYALSTLGVIDIRLVAPSSLLPESVPSNSVSLHTDLQRGIAGADVVIALRLQRERMQNFAALDTISYFQQYGLTEERLRHAKPDAIIMHPGPMNRGVEIDSIVADGPQSVIFHQPKFGVAVRMAIMALLQAE
jgi:aspartate carbamoyltransferase catalytic subunit